MRHFSPILLWLLVAVVVTPAQAAGEDPLASPSWPTMHALMLDGEPFEFSDAVTVLAPPSAEDPTNVPVMVTVADGLAVTEIVVFADLNPIQRVLEFYPEAVPAALGFRLKIEQGTPIRAAARLDDGRWLVGGTWVDAAGGGCTAPSAGRVEGNWYETLGEFRYRAFGSQETLERLRFQVMHPMDTGLAPGIPPFYINEIRIDDATGAQLALMRVYEPVSENPYFTVDFAQHRWADGQVTVHWSDIGGNRFDAKVDKGGR